MIRVVIPYGGNDPHRARGLAFVWDNLGDLLPDATVHVGQINGQWSKALAVNAALDPTWPDDDILVIHDADVWVPKLPHAVDVVASNLRRWATPHTMVHRLNQALTADVIDGKVPFTGLGKTGMDQPPYRGVVGGGCVVLSRASYRQVPLDPRFVGWGQEDESWGYAMRRVLGQPHIGNGKLFHLWHPHPERMTRSVGNRDGEALRNRYRAARRSREDMEALLDEFRAR